MSEPRKERIGFLHKERKITQRTQKSMTASDALERIAFVPFPFFVVKFLGPGWLVHRTSHRE
jgi:hypothetical protein